MGREEGVGFEDAGADGACDGGFYFGFGAGREVFFEHCGVCVLCVKGLRGVLGLWPWVRNWGGMIILDVQVIWRG